MDPLVKGTLIDPNIIYYKTIGLSKQKTLLRAKRLLDAL